MDDPMTNDKNLDDKNEISTWFPLFLGFVSEGRVGPTRKTAAANPEPFGLRYFDRR